MKNSSKSWRRDEGEMIHLSFTGEFPIMFPSSSASCRGKMRWKISSSFFIARHFEWNFNNCSLSFFTASQSVCSSPSTNIKTFSTRLSLSLLLPFSYFLSFRSFRFLCHAQLVCCGWCIFDIKVYFIFGSSFFHSFFRFLIRLSSPLGWILH